MKYLGDEIQNQTTSFTSLDTVASSFKHKSPTAGGRTKFKKQFTDSVRIYVEGGHGGEGLKRYGGIGGKGGDVFVVSDIEEKKQAQRGVFALNRLREICQDLRWIGGRGQNSERMAVQGLPGKDTYIPVPLGVMLVDDTTEELLGEINRKSDKVLICRGGEGGVPATQYRSTPGEKRFLRAEYKMIADIGLVGYPNAGKSSLMSVLCGATPRIAAYPFTTMKPELGMINYTDYRQVSVADLPGLIEGAHKNIGLGHKFLKHCERTNLLLMVVDLCGFRHGPKAPLRRPFETIALLTRELELYQPSLLNKPAALVLNKLDKEGARKAAVQFLYEFDNYERYLEQMPPECRPSRPLKFDSVYLTSTMTRHNIEMVRNEVRDIIDRHDDAYKMELHGDRSLLRAKAFLPSLQAQLM